jgi:hypothetical protein
MPRKVDSRKNARHHPDGEVDEEQATPEDRHLLPLRAFHRVMPRPVGRGLHDGQQQGEADGEWDEDEVEDGGDTELPAGEEKCHHR